MQLSEQQLSDLLKELISYGKEKGYITSDDLCSRLEKVDATPEQFDEVYKGLEDNNISVVNDINFEKRKGLYRQDYKRDSH